jgi:type I site-specific restriction-modification system R (restriction) subunit
LINDLANGGFYLFIASPKSCGIKLDQTSFYRLKKGDFLFNIHRLFIPDISILSEEFLLELKGMEHKNVALEVLKKLLNDELKSRSRKNLVKSNFIDKAFFTVFQTQNMIFRR